MRKGVILLLLAFVFVMALEAVSAGILIGQPDNVYNVGDTLELDVTLQPSVAANDFLTLNLDCGNESIEIYRNSFNLAAEEEVTIGVITLMSSSLIGDVIGSCNLLGSYNGETGSSQSFEISNEINVDLEMEENRFVPGEDIEVTGQALKRSGSAVSGFIEVSISTLGVSLSNIVTNNQFSFNFTLPENALSGNHVLNVLVFDEDNFGEVSNMGEANETIEVVPVLNDVSIVLSSQNVAPGEDLTYTVNALDQADQLFSKELALTIYEPGEFIYLEQVVDSGESNSLELDSDLAPGYWKIEAVAEDFSARKLFYVEEIAKVQTSLVNNTLIVTNTGNVIYRDPIEVSIGSSVQVKQLDLDVGETKRFRLLAPDGTYLVGVTDNGEEKPLGNVLLTGNAIGVEEIGNFVDLAQPIWWFVGIIVLILIIAYIQVRRVRKRNKNSVGKGVEKIETVSKTGKSSILNGKKEEAAAIAIKLKSKEKSIHAQEYLKKAIKVAKESGGKVYEDGDYKILLFVPSLTKVKNNDVLAVRVAKKISEIFDEYNSKFKSKILFGIGVNKGEIIGEKKGSEFEFTTTGNIVSRAKRIAYTLDKEALLTDTIRRSVVNVIKSDKARGKDAWRITKITDRAEHKDFLSKFKHKDKK